MAYIIVPIGVARKSAACTLGESFANRTVLVEDRGKGEVLITLARSEFQPPSAAASASTPRMSHTRPPMDSIGTAAAESRKNPTRRVTSENDWV
jgi:hypothetical protein